MDNLFPALGKATVVIVSSIFAIMVARSWLFDKALEAVVAMGLICAIYADAALIMMTWGTVWAYVFGFGGVAGLVALTALPELGLRKQERDYVEAEIARLRHQTEIDPRNAAAWEFLGDKLLTRREFDAALEAYNQALQTSATRRDAVSGVPLGNVALQAKMRKAQAAKDRAEGRRDPAL